MNIIDMDKGFYEGIEETIVSGLMYGWFDKHVAQKIAKCYDNELGNLSLTIPYQSPDVYSSYHLYPILIKANSGIGFQKQVYEELRKNDIAVNLHYIPVHRHPYYENLGFKKNDFPEAEKFYQEVISIPMYAILKDVHQEYVVETLKKVMKAWIFV